MYFVNDLRFFGSLLSGGRVFHLALSTAGQASLPWVLYEACLDLGRAPWRRSARRLAGSIWQGIAFRLPETSRSLGTPQIVFQILIFIF